MHGVILDLESLGSNDLDLDNLIATLDSWDLHESTKLDQAAERIRDADVVISNKALVDRRAMQTAAKLKLICVAATGTNNVDLVAAEEAGVQVSNVRAYGTDSVVEHAFAGLLSLFRRLDDYRQAVAAGKWQQSRQFCLLDFPIRQLSGSVMGIVGYGELGRGVARVAKAFGMRVLLAQRPGGAPMVDRVALHELLPQVDVLSLHCPLTEHTQNLIASVQLASMKEDAVLINLARGGIVNEMDLVAALKGGVIGGAYFDVLTTEPPVLGNPLLDADLPNLLLTPHIAWASQPSRQRLVNELVENVTAFRRGEARNLVSA